MLKGCAALQANFAIALQANFAIALQANFAIALQRFRYRIALEFKMK
jgi:hypothetical protein